MYDKTKPVSCNAGQFDLLDGPPACERWLGELIWSGAAAFSAASRQVWRVQESAAFLNATWQPGSHATDIKFGSPCCQVLQRVWTCPRSSGGLILVFICAHQHSVICCPFICMGRIQVLQ